MKIELGKYYRTRDGQKHRIICVDCPGECNLVVLSDKGRVAFHYPDGRCAALGNQGRSDLIAEWIDKPVVDWSKMPAWAKWVARIGYAWAWFDHKPIVIDNQYLPTNGRWDWIPSEYCPVWSGDWRESLVERPTV